MITSYQIRALVNCTRYKSKYPRTMFVRVAEDDDMPQYPPCIDGCLSCSTMSPCPACIAFVKNAVFHAMPISNGSTIEIYPDLNENILR